MRRAIIFSVLLFAATLLPAQSAFLIEGHVTAIHSPTSFEAGGRIIALTAQTNFGFIGSDVTSTMDPARNSLEIGTFVQVAGRDPGTPNPIIAAVVYVDRNPKVSGIGVITRVVSPPPEPIYEADGYLIHILSSTNLSFAGDLGSLAEVTTNTWIHYTGKRNVNGMLMASHAQFISAKPTKFKAIKGIEVAPVQMRPVNPVNTQAQASTSSTADGASVNEDEQVKVGLGKWHIIPSDQPMQQRVHRIGMALVPTFQRQLDDADPTKIHFRFFAVDDKKLHNADCLPDGLVLVSTEAVQRLTIDDQLAAVLADGIACQLQRQTAREVMNMRAQLGIELAIDVAKIAIPPAGFAAGAAFAGTAAGALSGGDKDTQFAEERLRVALALMQDAGYDPWQAPEAWRLLEPKKLPANLASLEYPEASAYQIIVLNLQYPRDQLADIGVR